MSDTDIIRLDEIPDEEHLGEFYACEDGDNFDELSPGLLAFGTTSRHVKCLWLPAQFKKWGVRFKLVEGWETRGRPLSAGYFDPNASLTHHTGTTSSAARPAPSLSTIINGRSDLKGPLAQVSTDYNGLTYIIAAGRANHAGKARATMGNPAGDGNAMYIGNEVQTNGTQKMPQAQYDAVVLVAAAIADYFKQTTATKVGLHATTSLSGKWDLGAGNGTVAPYSITRFRADVANRLRLGPPSVAKPPVVPTTPPGPTSPDWSTMATRDEIKQAVREVMAEKETARQLFTAHDIMKDVSADDPETAPRVTPSRDIEIAGLAALGKPVTPS